MHRDSRSPSRGVREQKWSGGERVAALDIGRAHCVPVQIATAAAGPGALHNHGGWRAGRQRDEAAFRRRRRRPRMTRGCQLDARSQRWRWRRGQKRLLPPERPPCYLPPLGVLMHPEFWFRRFQPPVGGAPRGTRTSGTSTCAMTYSVKDKESRIFGCQRTGKL